MKSIGPQVIFLLLHGYDYLDECQLIDSRNASICQGRMCDAQFHLRMTGFGTRVAHGQLNRINLNKSQAASLFVLNLQVRMEESEELLLNGLGESVRRVGQRLMNEGKEDKGVKKTGEEVLSELINSVGGENKETLLRIQSYYNQIIKQLNNQIDELQHQLNKMNTVASNDKIAQQPGTLKKRGLSSNSPKAADIPYQEDQMLLTYTKTKLVHNPSMSESIVFDYEDDWPTQKKDSVAPDCLPLTKNVNQTDRTVLFNQQRSSGFQLELDNIKTQLRKIRSSLQADDLTIIDQVPSTTSTALHFKLLQINQTKNMKQHLINQNLKLRETIQHLKGYLSSIPAQLTTVKHFLHQTLSCLQ